MGVAVWEAESLDRRSFPSPSPAMRERAGVRVLLSSRHQAPPLDRQKDPHPNPLPPAGEGEELS